LDFTALLLLSALLVGCERSGNAAPQAAPARPPTAVTAFTAVTRDVPIYLDQIGKTVAVQVVSIVPQVAGKVMAAPVENGAYIKKGDLLFEIDPRPFEATLASAKATLAQCEAEAAWARADFKRTEELMATNSASQLEYDQKKSTLQADQAKIEGAKAAIMAAELDVEYTKIYAPVDGRAGVRLIDRGNVVKANEGSMLMIQQLDPIYAEFTITENDLGTVRKFMAARGLETGNEAGLGLKAFVDVPGDSAQILTALEGAATRPTTQSSRAAAREGTLTFLDNAVQGNTGTVRLRATVPNPDRYFWPGQFVNVRLILATKKDAVLVPVVAQQIGQQGAYVYVVKPDQTAEVRPITPGQRQADMLVVEKGLEPGERVIVAGQLAVVPNGKVMVTNPPATQSAGGM
jgi:multidrug efflux system membrane fusion protein